ncbi:AMP-binding protein [Aeromicrobium sp. CnD17-E]|uniref:AMP-binding protein n=1 Tax=Aeromicrobium sp. CnD17-E TaxID=2954487 RepID=UPI0020969B50|nr:AMP-binding protein [Aeromicrobium sp. CnD17-E]MCO7240079.1 AMP-binding protein [Aeromicrobium sp. CnD17-E]
MTDLPIGRAFAVLAERAPDAVAVHDGDDAWTRRRLEDDTNRLARSWKDRVGLDDVVTVALPSGIDLVRACVAAWKLGATPQPLAPTLDVAERQAVLDLTGPALVVDGPLGEVDGDPRPLPDAVASSWKAPTSSGSTGRPKVVRAAAPSTVDLDRPVAPFVPRHAVQLVASPLFHAAPFVYAMRGLMTGHELVLVPTFDPAGWLRLVEHHRVTWSVLVPATMQRVHRLGPDALAAADVSSLEQVLHLGARCPAWLKRAWIDWLGPERVVEVYAGTESQGVAMITGTEWLAHPGSVGRGCGGTRFRVARPDGEDCAPGERGEILMRREHPTYSYVGAEPTVRDGWHTLGDVGYLDADGFLFVEDRLADVVTTGGMVVYPADVEGVLEAHPEVRSCVVVPADDDRLGQVVHAVVETDADLADLERWATDRLSPERRPRSWQRVAEPLRADTGKVNRSRWRPSTDT